MAYDGAPSKVPISFRDDVELRMRCQKRREAAIREREPYIKDWQQVADYIEPGRGRFDEPMVAGVPVRKAQARNRNRIIDNTATRAVRVCTAGMSSHVISKARPWFSLETPYPELNELYDVRVWLEDVTEIISDILAKSNFYKAMPVMFCEDVMFGVAAMLSVQDDDEVVRFVPLTAGTYAIGLDDKGRVDMLWRSWTDTARNIVDCYGIENVPNVIKTAYQNNPDTRFVIESIMEKNPKVVDGMGPYGIRPVTGRPYRELVWLQGLSSDPHGLIFVGGHYEAPFVCFRWNPVGDEIYSTSPCIDSLGDIKQLQYQAGQYLRLVDLVAEPPLGVPEYLRNKPASLSPKSKTYLPDQQTGAQAAPLYTPEHGAMSQVIASMQACQERINSTLFVPLFLMLDSLGDKTGRTATEIAERKEEKVTVLGPTLEVVTDEGLDPTIVRVFGMANRAGKIPPPPQALDNVPLKIVYSSILAQAMKASGTIGIERLVSFATGVMGITKDPSSIDKIDFDQAYDEYAERVGAPARILRSDEAVGQMRAGRAQQAQAAQMAQAAKPTLDFANAASKLATTVPDEDSMLANVQSMVGGGQ